MTILILIGPAICAFLMFGLAANIFKDQTLKLCFRIIYISTFILVCHQYFLFLLKPSISIITYGEWISYGDIKIKWEFLFDSLTYIMLFPIIVISGLVHAYAYSYLYEDKRLAYFLGFVSLFTFFMLLLVTSANLVITFLGWEGVGFCSYILINFWYTRVKANKAAFKAIIINRIGDFALLLAISIIYLKFHTFSYNELISLIAVEQYINIKSIVYINILGYRYDYWNVVCLLLMIGAMAKSAQFGLHTWLPDAMEGPTPVSALIHAATMVTAGIFLILRCSFFFDYAPVISQYMTVIGALTCFFAATIGLYQYDIKKVIAFSTCSQLGYMFFACGTLNYNGSLYHLFTHAFFKALLFLAAGSVIHAVQNEQSMRKMGGLMKLLPITYISMFIGSLALIGFPFLSGFYSKDFIIEYSYNIYTVNSLFAFWLGSLSACLTAFYSYRLLYLTFLCDTNVYKSYFIKIHETRGHMKFALVVLCILSITLGYFFSDIFIGTSTNFFDDSLAVQDINSFNCEIMPLYYKLLPLIFSILGIIFSHMTYSKLSHYYQEKRFKNRESFSFILFNRWAMFFNQKWFFDKLQNDLIGYPLLHLFKKVYINLDRGLLDYLTCILSSNIWYIISYKFSKSLDKKFTTYVDILIINYIICIYVIIGYNIISSLGDVI